MRWSQLGQVAGRRLEDDEGGTLCYHHLLAIQGNIAFPRKEAGSSDFPGFLLNRSAISAKLLVLYCTYTQLCLTQLLLGRRYFRIRFMGETAK